MTSRTLMWELYQTAKQYNQLPSQVLFISDGYDAYCLNQVVTMWGNHVTNELEKIEGKDAKAIERKRRDKLNQLLQIKDTKRFRQVGPALKGKGGE